MSRRVTLPGADELFRKTTLVAVPEVELEAATDEAPRQSSTPQSQPKKVRTTARRKPNQLDKAPTGREKHDEKITVYLSPDELFDLEQARLMLRGDLGLAVDRGRIVREALAVIIADLESKGDQSIIARRLRGR